VLNTFYQLHLPILSVENVGEDNETLSGLAALTLQYH
jgi:hypothetical protein